MVYIYIYMCTTPTTFIYLPLKMPSLYTYVHQLRVISDPPVKQQMDPWARTDHDGQFPLI